VSSKIEFFYPPERWQQLRREARKAMAREYINNHQGYPGLSKQEAAGLRLEVIRSILAGLLEYDSNTKHTELTDFGQTKVELLRLNDPVFVEKVEEVIGQYLHPLAHAVALGPTGPRGRPH
jgi:hypothetical protein